MARAQNKNRARRHSRPQPVVKNQLKATGLNQQTGDKIPHSMVFRRGKVPWQLKHLELDLRKVMLPYTAFDLKEKKRNKLKDFLNVAGPLAVTHFLILTYPTSMPHLRVAKTPQGPTLTFEIHEYALAADIAKSQIRYRCPKELFNKSPLMVISGFGTGDQHLKLATIMFQNIFPTIDPKTAKLSQYQRLVLLNYNSETKLIDFRHYSIRLTPAGVSRRIKKFVQNHKVPNLGNLQDVSDFLTKAGYGSESEAEDEAATITLNSDVGRVNRASHQSRVILQEIGPRMTLNLVKVEEGLCSGNIIFSAYGKEAGGGRSNEGADTLSVEED